MSESQCSIPGCLRPRWARGWCDTHYTRWRKHGDPTIRLTTKQQAMCRVPGCANPPLAKNLCSKHYQTPPERKTRASKGEPHQTLAAILAIETDECVEWPHSRDSYGYGRIWIDGRHHGVHALICEHVHGLRPVGLVARHTCGPHPWCCNPRHVEWGTQSQNNSDAELRDRTKRRDLRGRWKGT